LQRDYRIESTPSTDLLGESGEILFSKDGYAPGDEKPLEAKIVSALKIPAPADPGGALLCPAAPASVR
jgi:hypothetical protein